MFEAVDWAAVVQALGGPGWVRLAGVVEAETCTGLLEAAPPEWSPVIEDEGGGTVHQGGLSSHAEVSRAEPVVQIFAQSILEMINEALPQGIPELPEFNHAQWGRSLDGVGFITRHRDPPTAGGIIAITTLSGRTRFRVWDGNNRGLPSAEHDRRDAHEWDTADGDLVVLRGGDWPAEGSRCPVHEVKSPPEGDRVTLTLRHNKAGFGSDYFAQ